MIGPVTGARAVVAAALVVIGVSACSGDDPEPRLAPSESSSPSAPSTSPASGTTAPTMPAEAVGTDAAAAEAFVRFYWEMVNYAQETGEVRELAALGKKCSACESGVATVVDTYAGDGAIRGGDARLVELETSFLVRSGDDWAVVECDLITTEQVVDLPGKSRDERFSGGRTPIRVILEPVNGVWMVRSMVTL
jgi:Family of unknown function (DUF6318)